MIEHLTPLDINAMSSVKRWHTVDTRRPQNLAEHSYRVAALAVWLGHDLNKQPDAETEPFTSEVELAVWRLAAVHDTPETQYGDVPSPTKCALGGLTGVAYDEIMDGAYWARRGAEVGPWAAAPGLARRLVIVADILEALLFWTAEGLTQKRPGDELSVADRLIRECWAAVDRELPALESAVAVAMVQGGLPERVAYRFSPEEV